MARPKKARCVREISTMYADFSMSPRHACGKIATVREVGKYGVETLCDRHKHDAVRDKYQITVNEIVATNL